jgi:PEP-CTERM motif
VLARFCARATSQDMVIPRPVVGRLKSRSMCVDTCRSQALYAAPTVAAVPEPGTLGLMGTGLMELALFMRRRPESFKLNYSTTRDPFGNPTQGSMRFSPL